MSKPKYVPNPVLRYPVNAKCPCMSGRKFKKCCLVDFKEDISIMGHSLVPVENAEIYAEMVREFMETGKIEEIEKYEANPMYLYEEEYKDVVFVWKYNKEEKKWAIVKKTKAEQLSA